MLNSTQNQEHAPIMAVVFFCGTSPHTESNNLRSGSPGFPDNVMLILRHTNVRPSLSRKYMVSWINFFKMKAAITHIHHSEDNLTAGQTGPCVDLAYSIVDRELFQFHPSWLREHTKQKGSWKWKYFQYSKCWSSLSPSSIKNDKSGPNEKFVRKTYDTEDFTGF